MRSVRDMLRGARILGSAGKPGVYRAVLIEAGRSLNGNTYTATMLKQRAAEGLFEGRPGMCFMRVDADGNPLRDHVGPVGLVGRAPLNTAVVFRNTRWDESLQAVVGDMAVLAGTEVGDELERTLRALEAHGAITTFGLSIDGEGPVDAAGNVDLRQINSVDVVTRPAAGGRVLHRIAASRGTGAPAMRTLLALLTASHARLVEGYTGPEGNDFGIARHILGRAKADAAVAGLLAAAIGGTGEAKRFTESKDEFSLFGEVVDLCARVKEDEAKRVKEAQDAEAARQAEAARLAAAAGGSQTSPEDRRRIEALEKLAREQAQRLDLAAIGESRARLTAACKAAKIGAKAESALLLQHGNRALADGEPERLVEATRAMIDDAIQGAGGSTTTIVRESQDRQRDLLAHAFNPGQVPAPKEGAPAYIGDGLELFERHFFGGARVKEAFQGGYDAKRRFAEAVNSTTSAKTLQDAMEIAMLAAYNNTFGYTGWQKIVRKTTLPNFRTAHILKVPYAANLPVVAKGAPYVAVTTSTETEETLALVKYGGLESILLEDLLNGDFLDLWQQRLQRLGRAAMETRSEVVHALHRDATMPTLGADSKTLTDSTRSPANEGTSVMSSTLATAVATVMEAITGMMAATGGSGVAKGIIPRYIVLPKEKVGAYNAVLNSLNGASALDFQATAKRMGWYIPEPIIDLRTTNAYDHYFFADPNDAEVLRFAELAGRSGPRIEIADQGNVGAMFTNDKLEAKISDVFAAGAVDSAGIYGNDAAS